MIDVVAFNRATFASGDTGRAQAAHLFPVRRTEDNAFVTERQLAQHWRSGREPAVQATPSARILPTRKHMRPLAFQQADSLPDKTASVDMHSGPCFAHHGSDGPALATLSIVERGERRRHLIQPPRKAHMRCAITGAVCAECAGRCAVCGCASSGGATLPACMMSARESAACATCSQNCLAKNPIIDAHRSSGSSWAKITVSNSTGSVCAKLSPCCNDDIALPRSRYSTADYSNVIQMPAIAVPV